MKYFGYNIRHK